MELIVPGAQHVLLGSTQFQTRLPQPLSPSVREPLSTRYIPRVLDTCVGTSGKRLTGRMQLPGWQSRPAGKPSSLDSRLRSASDLSWIVYKTALITNFFWSLRLGRTGERVCDHSLSTPNYRV